MQILQVRHHKGTVHIAFNLDRFITDWQSAQQKFISGIVHNFHDWQPIRAGDFTLAPAFALQDLRCECKLFRGACSLVLTPEALRLDFENVTPQVEPIVSETIRRAWRWFVEALEDHGLAWSSFQTLSHMEALETNAIDVDSYLGQFVSEETGKLVEPDICLPSTRLVLVGSGEWVLYRVVEKSKLVDKGVFVDTRVEIQSSDLSLDDQMKLLFHARTQSAKALGLDTKSDD